MTVLFSWLSMQIVHELGHIIHSHASKAEVKKVILHPLKISRTDVEPNSIMIVWGGAIWGVTIPLFAWMLSRFRQAKSDYLFAFFAGFCCIANGAYFGSSLFYPVGDAHQLLKYNVPIWIPLVYGVTMLGCGFWLWHGLAKRFGLGKNADEISTLHTLILSALTFGIVVWELFFFHG